MFKISLDQLNALANYLGEHPFKQVNGLIKMISSLEKIEEKPELKEVDLELKQSPDNKR